MPPGLMSYHKTYQCPLPKRVAVPRNVFLNGNLVRAQDLSDLSEDEFFPPAHRNYLPHHYYFISLFNERGQRLQISSKTSRGSQRRQACREYFLKVCLTSG